MYFIKSQSNNFLTQNYFQKKAKNYIDELYINIYYIKTVINSMFYIARNLKLYRS